MKLGVSQAAAADLVRLHEFLAGKSPVAAERAAAVLMSAVRSICTLRHPAFMPASRYQVKSELD
jgi:hypothetical protein